MRICTEVAIYRVLEWSQHRTRSWESRSLKVSMLSASVTSFGRAFHRRVPSGKNPRWYAKVRAYGTRNWALPVLLLAGASMMWSDARMSTRPWTILYIMVMRAFARRSARGSQPRVFSMAVTLLICSRTTSYQMCHQYFEINTSGIYIKCQETFAIEIIRQLFEA